MSNLIGVDNDHILQTISPGTDNICASFANTATKLNKQHPK